MLVFVWRLIKISQIKHTHTIFFYWIRIYYVIFSFLYWLSNELKCCVCINVDWHFKNIFFSISSVKLKYSEFRYFYFHAFQSTWSRNLFQLSEYLNENRKIDLRSSCFYYNNNKKHRNSPNRYELIFIFDPYKNTWKYFLHL